MILLSGGCGKSLCVLSIRRPGTSPTTHSTPCPGLARRLARTGLPKDAPSLARQCGETARKAFANSKDFWDAVMSVDAEMTAWLLDGALEDPDAETESAGKNPPAWMLKNVTNRPFRHCRKCPSMGFRRQTVRI